MPFLREETIDIRQTGDTTFELVSPIRYDGRHDTFVVPAGQETDFASVPRAITWLVPRYGRWTKAAILHDYLYRSRVVSPRDADGIFRRALREQGVPLYKRWMMWTAVRLHSILFKKGLPGTTGIDFVVLVLMALLNTTLLFVPFVVVSLFSALYTILNWISALFDGKMRRDLREAEVQGVEKDVLL